MKTPKFLLATLMCILLSLVLISCGGGGGGGGSTADVPPSDDLRGGYKLTNFVVYIYEDVNCTKFVDTLGPGDFESWSGSMEIGDTSISQTIRIEGEEETLTGSYTVTYTSGTTDGIFHIVDTSGTHDVPFSIDGFYLETDSGCLEFFGFSFREHDTWKKIDDYASRQAPSTSTLAASGSLGSLGAILASPKVVE